MAYARLVFPLVIIACSAAPALAARKDVRKAGPDKEAQEPAATKEAKERAAKKACLNRDPVKGVELLTALYVDNNDPIYIYNQGRCYEQNDRCEDAIVRFREYLRKTAGGSESDRRDVQKHIADCEDLLAKRAGDTASARGAAGVTAAPVLPPTVPEQPIPSPTDVAQPVATTVAGPQHVASPGSGLRGAGIVTMAVGGAALIAGVVLNLKHNSMIHDLKGDYSGDTADSAQSYKTMSMLGYGVGAAGLVGGAVLYWLGWRASKTAMVPAVVAGNAGLLLTGRF